MKPEQTCCDNWINHPVRLEVSDGEMCKRREALLDAASELGVDALCFFNPVSIFYLTRFRFILVERPTCFVLTPSHSVCFVPHLERRHLEQFAFQSDVSTYPEYPGIRHPMEFLKDLLVDLGLQSARIGADASGAPRVCGYRGPSLASLMPEATIIDTSEIIPKMRQVKTTEEITLIRLSARWGSLAHRYLQDHTIVGRYENEISLRARLDATMAMVHMYGEKDRSFSGISELGAGMGFRGQIGVHSGIPHSLTRNAVVRDGDVLITGVGANMGGYHSELERTMIVGEPTAKQRKHFNLMVECQDEVLNAIRPGATWRCGGRGLP